MVSSNEGSGNFFDHWPAVRKNLKGKEIFLFLDYDGTLTPIMPTPDQAVMSDGMRDVLSGLLKIPRCHVLLVSGRKLSDLKKIAGIPGVTYVGSHGFEAEGHEDISKDGLVPSSYLNDHAALRGGLRKKLSSLQGIMVEDKGVILTVHFRAASKQVEASVKNIVGEACRDLLENGRIRVMEGNKVIEILPPVRWNKGEAVMRLISQREKKTAQGQAVAVYIGDDTTDEDAFALLHGKGITVRVGKNGSSRAQYYLDSQNDVQVVLREILHMMQKGDL